MEPHRGEQPHSANATSPRTVRTPAPHEGTSSNMCISLSYRIVNGRGLACSARPMCGIHPHTHKAKAHSHPDRSGLQLACFCSLEGSFALSAHHICMYQYMYGLSRVPEVRRRSMPRRRRSRTRPARRASAPRGARGTRRSVQRSAGAVQPIVRPSAIECSVLRHGASWGHMPAVQRRTAGSNRVTGSANTSTTWAPGRRRAPVDSPRTNAPHKPAAQQP
jgi:hypothetical protein